MSGAIIPDDWDGSTFECQRIEWPASPKWRAILLGQATEPGWQSYWDANTGDVEDAARAANDAYELTVPDIYTEECEEMPVLQSAFKVRLNAAYPMGPATEYLVFWEAYEYQWNNPGFNLPLSGHEADSVGKYGVWHYDVELFFQPQVAAFYTARAWAAGIGQIARDDQELPRCQLSFDWVWPPYPGNRISIYVYSSVSTALQSGVGDTHFSGHYLGPVVE